MAQVTVKRTDLPAPTVDDPERKVVQIEYRSGELPPRFIYIPKAEWSKEKEAEEIKKDLEKVTTTTTETVEI